MIVRDCVFVFVLRFILIQMCACATQVQVPSLRLYNGLPIPGIALGTYLAGDQVNLRDGAGASYDKFQYIVERAIDIGYRHLDTAAIYGTERAIGAAVNASIAKGTVARGDIYITTKLWNTDHGSERVPAALQKSLKALATDYVDLYLMHWPMALDDKYNPVELDYLVTWKAMEAQCEQGHARSIGVSNFNKRQLERLLDEATIKPAVLEIEVHPDLVQEELVEYCRERGIVVMAYSPFGSLVSRYRARPTAPWPLDAALVELAGKHNKTTLQVVLRWLIDRGTIPIPKTVREERLLENIDVFDFRLEADEVERIGSFETRRRHTLPSFWQDHPHYPWERVDNPIADPFNKQ